MRQAENTGPGPVSVPEGQGRSPIKVGAGVLAVVLAAWGLLWLTTRPEEPRGPGVESGPAFALTDAEAINRLRFLLNERDEAFHKRSVVPLPSIYASGSPVGDIARSEIRRLTRDGVLDRSQFVTLNLEIVVNTAQQIQIRQEVEVSPQFITEDGDDVTDSPRKLRQTILWTLKLERGAWKIQDSVLERSSAVKGQSG